uniref:Uncharacterized protein n=1 Tax=Triticum urartu TaxID=4572 RepID=A0A8R7R5J3_TRIUA
MDAFMCRELKPRHLVRNGGSIFLNQIRRALVAGSLTYRPDVRRVSSPPLRRQPPPSHCLRFGCARGLGTVRCCLMRRRSRGFGRPRPGMSGP